VQIAERREKKKNGVKRGDVRRGMRNKKRKN
jgi:hypothetical protein